MTMRDSSELSREFGQRVRTARRHAGLSQLEVGGRLGLARTSVVNIEAGRQGSAVEWIDRLATAVCADAGWLVTGRVYDGDNASTPLAAWTALRRCETLLTDAAGLVVFAKNELVPKGLQR